MGFSSWLSIEGDTPEERIRNGLPQLIVVGVFVWVGAFVAWEFLAVVVGPAAAAIVVLVAGVYVGLDLRDRMLGPIDEKEEDSEEGEDFEKEEGSSSEEGPQKTGENSPQ